MLNRECRRFREEFTPGILDPHRETCPSCAAYAAALERAASAPQLAMPERLRGELKGVLPFVRHDAPRLPVPQTPLPAGLRDRLRAIPREQRREPPVWIRSSRWAVAASYFLTVVMLQAVGDPVALGRRTTDTLVRTWGQTWTEVREERLPRIGSAVVERYGATVGSLESSLSELESEAREMSDKTRLSFKEWIDRSDR
ncbi:MAG TPA: hypothetical protein VEW48_07565 [Thermoanaerobaculia bacterium]|nr:hypothetical protein [Thermoanaerobaculia bacterium]